MLRKLSLWALIALLLTFAGAGLFPARAQGGANAWTSYELKMRTGPGKDQPVITVLASGVGLVLEARNADTSWLLVHTEDGAYRGWVASLYLRYAPGVAATTLPVSGEIVAGGAAAPAPAPAEAAAPPEANNAPGAPPPGGVTAYTTGTINVRSGPGTGNRVIGRALTNTGIVVEARDAGTAWILGHSEDGSVRGWMSARYLRFEGVIAANLPVSGEILNAPASSGGPIRPGTTSENINYQDVMMGGYDPSRLQGIDLAAFPVVARPTGRSRDIFLNGRALGNNPNVITKVGDCSSEHWFFLSPFAWGQYNLGSYTNLQDVVNFFGSSLGVDSEATHNGFNVNAVLAPEWANPASCMQGESPLQCEFRLRKPSVAIIMFGTSDLLVMSPYEFDFYMRDIVEQSIKAGVIPVLSTFPGNLNFWNKTLVYNQIVIRIALDYDVPLINLWLALEALPNHGLEPDGFHLGEPLDSAGNLSGNNLNTGYPMRNLVTLQSLDAIWRSSMQ